MKRVFEEQHVDGDRRAADAGRGRCGNAGPKRIGLGRKRGCGSPDDWSSSGCRRRGVHSDCRAVRLAREALPGNQRRGCNGPRAIGDHAGHQRRFVRGHRGRERDRRRLVEPTMVDFGLLPPEINSALMYSGPGSAPMLAAAAAWKALASELHTTASSYATLINGLTDGPWQGPSAASMAAAAFPQLAWLSGTAGQADEVAGQAAAAAGAYEAAFAQTVPPP